MNNDRREDPFVAYLYALRNEGNRAALATLKRGLGRQIGDVPEIFRYVVPRLPRNISPWEERVYYLVASLFAMHPLPGGKGDLGNTLRELDESLGRGREDGESSTERRLMTLMKSDTETLPEHLRQVVSLVSANDLPIDWSNLLWDLKRWNRGDKMVQKKWAESFWNREE